MTNTAKRVIIPAQSGVFRTIFLYTGQGDSTLLVIPHGSDYRVALLDCDRDKDPDEVNLIKMFKDLFEGTGRKLDVFINTHPHNDHISGIREIYDEIGIEEVWHSNHKPGRLHKEKYEDLYYVIKSVGKEKEFHLKGTNKPNKVRTSNDEGIFKPLWDIGYQVLSPANHLCEEIDDAGAVERDRRIHEKCGVIRFTYGSRPSSILMTGDSDVATWRDHIMYHENALSSLVLHASHHGSNTFFREREDQDPYRDHMDAIKPEYIIVSAPKKGDSPYGHPDDFAMSIYKEYVQSDKLYHLGKKPCSVIVDIYRDGNYFVYEDTDLIQAYCDGNDNDGGGGKKEAVGFTRREEVSQPRKGERFA